MSIFKPKPFDYFKLAFIKVNAAQQRYYFPDLPELRNVLLDSISFYSASIFPVNKEGVGLLNTALNLPIFLTLYSEGRERIQKLDCSYLSSIALSNTFTSNDARFNFNGMKVDFSKSYVQYSSASTPQAAPYSFLFGIFYTPVFLNNPTASNV
jgi:hypothetical protein